MTTALRPMSTGELLDRTFILYKRHFLLFIGISIPAPAILLLLIVASSILDTLPGANSSQSETAAVITAGIAVIVVSFGLLLGFALAHAATIRAVAALHLEHPTTISQAYRELRGHFLRVLGVFVSVAIRMFGGSLLVYMASAFVGAMAMGLSTLLGTAGIVIGVIIMVSSLVGGLVLALTLFVRYAYAVQACVIEDIPSNQALKRSAFLAKGSRNRVLTIYVLFTVISFALWGCVALVVGMGASFLHSPQVTSALMTGAFFLTLLLTFPLATVAMSLSYYDERVRKEGFDLQVLIAGLENLSANTIAAGGGPSTPL